MSKIEWCDATWNPVWGCKTNCPYCYAKKIAARFFKKIALREVSYRFNKGWHLSDPHGFDCNDNKENIYKELSNFKPTWLESNFNKSFPKKPKRIFVNSMSDIAYWNPEWIEKVLDKIHDNFHHTFIFLTKFPEIYTNIFFPKNCWLGITVTKNDTLKLHDFYFPFHSIKHHKNKNKTFLSIEPIQGKIDIKNIHTGRTDWIIIGAETGNRKNKITPEPEWIESFRDLDIPIFMKNNLRPIIGDNLKQEFPDAQNRTNRKT